MNNEIADRRAENDKLVTTSINKKLRIKELLKEIENNQEVIKELQFIVAKKSSKNDGTITEIEGQNMSSRAPSVAAGALGGLGR